MNEKKKKAKRFSPLDDRRIQFVLAVLLAIVAWSLVTLYFQTETRVSLDNVPVDFTYREENYQMLGLEIMNAPQQSVSLSITGQGSTVGRLTSRDFTVYPDYSMVSGAGETTLPLRVVCTSNAANEISVSISGRNTSVELLFDKVEEKVLPLTVDQSAIAIADGYMLYETTVFPQSITVSGPAQEIEALQGACLVATSEAPLQDTTRLTGDVQLLNQNGEVISSEYITMDYQQATVNFVVYKVATLPVVVDFINVPKGFDTSFLRPLLSLEQLTVAGPASVVDGMQEVSVGSFDLSSFALNKDYQMEVTLPTGIVCLENVKQVTLSFDTEGLVTRQFNLPPECVKVVNLPASYQLTVDSARIYNVELCGPASVLNSLTAESIVAQIDMSAVNPTVGQQTMAVSIYVPASSKVFAIGTYTVQVTITLKLSGESAKT